MCVFFALVTRGPNPFRDLRRIVAACLLAAGTAASGRAAEPAADLGGLAGSGAAIVPADAAFLSATLRARQQYDLFVKSNAFAALKELPAVRRALDSLEEQRTMPGSPLSMVDTFLQLPENEQAAQLLADLVATDTFVYGEPSCISFLRLLQKLQAAAPQPLEREAPEDGGGEDEDDDDDDDDEDDEDEDDDDGRGGSRQAAIVKALADNRDLLVVPDVVWGFRTTKPDAAKAQLARLEALLKFAAQAQPDLAQAIGRRQVAGGEFVVATIRGAWLPWHDLETTVDDELRGSADLEKVIDRLQALDLVIAVGLIGDRVILSIGDSVDHLEKLALPASGRKGLLATAPFTPLLGHKDKPLTGIAYVSGELAALGRQSTGGLDAFASLADEAVQGGNLSPEGGAEARQLLDKAEKVFAKRLPAPSPWLAFAFLTDSGYEGYAWDWAANQPRDGSRRLDLLEHVGGEPLAVAVTRLRSDPALIDDLAALAAGGWSFFKKHHLPRAKADDRTKAERFDALVAPLGARLVEVLRTKIVPAVADGQVGLVLDAETTSTRPVRDLPASSEPLPIVEPAIVLPLADAKLFREALSDLFEIADGLVDAVRAVDPDAVAADYEVPEPEKTQVAAGAVWSFPLTRAGLDEQLRPAIGIGEQAAVFSLVPGQVGRLLAASRLDTGAQLSTFDKPLAGAAALDFAGLVDAVRPWVVYVTRYGCVREREGEVADD